MMGQKAEQQSLLKKQQPVQSLQRIKEQIKQLEEGKILCIYFGKR